MIVAIVLDQGDHVIRRGIANRYRDPASGAEVFSHCVAPITLGAGRHTPDVRTPAWPAIRVDRPVGTDERELAVPPEEIAFLVFKLAKIVPAAGSRPGRQRSGTRAGSSRE